MDSILYSGLVRFALYHVRSRTANIGANAAMSCIFTHIFLYIVRSGRVR